MNRESRNNLIKTINPANFQAYSLSGIMKTMKYIVNNLCKGFY